MSALTVSDLRGAWLAQLSTACNSWSKGCEFELCIECGAYLKLKVKKKLQWFHLNFWDLLSFCTPRVVSLILGHMVYPLRFWSRCPDWTCLFWKMWLGLLLSLVYGLTLSELCLLVSAISKDRRAPCFLPLKCFCNKFLSIGIKKKAVSCFVFFFLNL